MIAIRNGVWKISDASGKRNVESASHSSNLILLQWHPPVNFLARDTKQCGEGKRIRQYSFDDDDDDADDDDDDKERKMMMWMLRRKRKMMMDWGIKKILYFE